MRDQLDLKRPVVEQNLEAGRYYLREEGEERRLSTDSSESMELGKYDFFKILEYLVSLTPLKIMHVANLQLSTVKLHFPNILNKTSI